MRYKILVMKSLEKAIAINKTIIKSMDNRSSTPQQIYDMNKALLKFLEDIEEKVNLEHEE